MARMAGSPHTRAAAEAGKISSDPPTVSATAASDHAFLGEHREVSLKNPLREICTAGSVRGDTPGKPRWTKTGTKLETADTAKEHLKHAGASPLGKASSSENMNFPMIRHPFAPLMCCPIAEMRFTMRHYSVVAFILLACIDSCIAFSQPVSAVPFQDISIPVEKRVDYLISRMTLEEKISQITNDSPAIPRLDIQAYSWSYERLHGLARPSYATLYPQANRMATLMDAEFVDRESDVISTKARAKVQRGSKARCSFDLLLDDLLVCKYKNFPRSPGGPGQETYGEDPFPTRRLVVALVEGLQGKGSNCFMVIATPKHFAVHSRPESERDRFGMEPSPHHHWDTHAYATFTN